MKTIGAIIKEKRLQLGLSQREMAKRLGIVNAMLCHWEQGHCVPNLYNICDLADFFGCTIDELCGRTSKR